MTVERELLWKAWPEGYLAQRGVKTVGDWQCVGAGEWGSNWIHVGTGGGLFPLHAPGFPDFEQARTTGHLLPNLVPETDLATWACAKQDLAAALGWPFDGDLTWRFDDLSDSVVALPGIYWSLRGATRHHFFDPLGPEPVTAPATALVLARARLRGEDR